ncbi:MFS general substrate transporter [Trichoderma longibrachiatum ATCC 18648]|uniref:MFS general substrate transporter n=1 Tax=Trichoderma longibrachiatum ATCC 18648 TaxID=983965 RepID=A0A2T4CF13_TRILO|nr:MFS general substrate transporter [Trichoderma longibrachiatum ATCC 18648]
MGRVSFDEQPPAESIQLDATTRADSSLSPDVASEHEGQDGVSLPPVDTGKDAMLFLTACFVIECLVWGFPFAFGIFQNYYSTHEPFKGSSSIAAIGTTAMGTMYLSAPFVFPLMRLYPRQNRYGPMAGLLIMCIALALSSFSQTVWHLILTQGVLFAVGGSICYGPCILYMDEWFVKRKGLAFGVMWSGTGLGGFAIPLLLEYLLGRYGLRTTLRIWAVALFVLTVPVVYFIKPRLPISATAHIKPSKLGFLFDRSFLVYQAANIAEALGFFMPGLYLPSYATSILAAFDPVMVFGYLAAGRGIGNVVSGPLSEALVKGMSWQGQAAGGYGSGYGPLIAFTGATAVVGGSSFLWKRIGWM